jgi:hypothetical protein
MNHCSGLLRQLVLVGVMIFLSGRQTISGPPPVTITWHNLSDSGCGANSNSGITTDVYNSNIDIQGVNALAGPIHVVASSADVLITVVTGASVITLSGNRCDGVTVTPTAALYLFADTGFNITFSMTSDLVFRGTNDKGTQVDLLVAVSGGGTVHFNPLGGVAVTFTQMVNTNTTLPNTGGASLYLTMGTASSFHNPLVNFERMLGAPSQNALDARINIGGRSLVGYGSLNPAVGTTAQVGTILFDALNTGTGRLALHMGDGSNFLASPRFITKGSTQYALSDIERFTLAGGQAQIVFSNSSPTAAGGVQVINQNTQQTNYASNPFCDNSFQVTGTQFGFILGANGAMQVTGSSYLDYIGLTTNYCPPVFLTIPPELADVITLESIVKARNPSAFIVDGSTVVGAANPIIQLGSGVGTTAGLFFRSGCDDSGSFVSTYTIDPLDAALGAGNIVFDVEAPLSLQGTNSALQAINILSIQTTPTGGQIVIRQGPFTFPARTFATDSLGNFLQYGKAAFLDNSRITLNKVAWVHTDENHLVLEENDVRSEPAYIGGDHLNLIKLGFCTGDASCNGLRNKFVLIDSPLLVQSNVAFTGVDLTITNSPGGLNDEQFIFFGNGRAVDDGTGRQMILGTDEGSFACDGGTIINRDAHLDIVQGLADPTPGLHRLTFTTQPNSAAYNNKILTTDWTGFYS